MVPFVAAFLLGFLAMTTASAQTFGSLSGTITDSSNAVVSGATVTITDTATGIKRSTKTGSSGYYSFPDLLAGTYSIRVEATGFQAQFTPAVKLDAAAPVSISYKVHVGDVKETMQVEAAAPELDRTSASMGDTFSLTQVENLPVNGHDFVRFAQLAPGAVLRTGNIADITFDGLTIYSGYFFFDGVDNTRLDAPMPLNGLEHGARLMGGSQETVAEFRVLANAYQAEYGRSAGGQVDVIGKSGTNHWHGEGYEFNRNESYDARNFFARTGPKTLFRLNDYGGNIGGPVFDKKTFIFANYEGNVQNIGVLTSGSTLSSTSRASALAAHPELAPIIADFPIGVDSTVNPQLANFSETSTNNVHENTGYFRIDHNFSQKDSLFARYAFNESAVSGPLFVGSPVYSGINARQIAPEGITSIAVHEQHVFSPRLINDALFGFARNSDQVFQAENNGNLLTEITGVSTYSGGLANAGYFPQAFQYEDAMTLVARNHTLKWGATVWRRADNQYATGHSVLIYSSVTNFINNSALQVTEIGANTGSHTRDTELGFYAQDDWQVARNLSINYGLRWDVASTLYDHYHNTQSYNPNTGALFAPGGEYFPANFRNFGPRLGVAYSPASRTVVRAGVGVYYEDFPLVFGVYAYDNTIPTNFTLTQAANPGLSYPFTKYNNGTSAIATVYGFPASKPDAYSIQYNLSVAQELRRGLSAQLAYVGNHGLHLTQQYDINLYNQGTTVRPNPKFGDIYLYGAYGNENYNGLQAILKAQFGGLTADLNYAYSHEIDTVVDAGLAATEPQDYNNIRAERASGSQDERQNFKYNIVYAIPMGSGHAFLGSSPSVARALVSGWGINSLGIMHSGIPQNVTQSVNTYGNGDLLNQRPNLVAGQNRYVPTVINSTGYVNYWNVNAWAYPATGSFGSSPRNPVFGPHFTQVDASLVKNTSIYKDQDIEFRIQMYNIFNHPNFAEPSGVYAPGSITFGEITSVLGTTLGFGAARQLELALKYKF